jgi:hypothetical protein
MVKAEIDFSATEANEEIENERRTYHDNDR